TGGRVENLDPNPLFNNWYLTDVFYKNDLGGLGGVFNDDRPPTNMTYLLESPYNFAGENFWLDWYGVNGVAFYPYALGDTVGNYTSRSSIFSTTIIDTSYGVNEVIVKPTSPSPIFTATNSTIVGLYSLSTSAEFEYQTLISMLSKMGLDSRYVIPIYLPTIQDVLKAPLNLLVTDSSTYSQQSQALRSVFDTSDVVVVSSIDGIIGSPSTTSPVGSHSLVNIPVSFSQLLNGQEPAAYSFANSTRLVPIQTVNPTGSTYYPAADIALSPSSWMNAYQTPNARGTFQTSGNSLIVNLTSGDPSTRSQFNILSHLSSLLPLTKGLTVSFSIQSSANITLGTVFTSPASCCPNYVANDTTIGPGVSYQMIIPFSSFSKWHNSTSMFGVTRDLTLALNLPPAEPNTIVKLTNVTISSPAYTIATLPSSVPLTSNGVVQYSTLVSGVGLLASTNSSTTILSPSSTTQESVLTISSLSGGQPGQQYDRVITVGGNQTITPSIGLFSESAWSPVHEEWTNNQNMVANNLPQGFRGLVWKETYTQFWTFTPESNGSGQPLPYYYAGPGMVYVQLSELVSSISATFNSTTPISIMLFSSPIATLIILAIFRKKLIALGRQGRIEPKT
ncbi:MAG TPA: hypothetical protein VFV92_01265, partial [Candidatus Bathyarchaeia archaeon]|nr:hypothetical protein [Candidatus Bathyarchaeia archaeon]